MYVHALITRKSCAVGMRNAILRNHLNEWLVPWGTVNFVSLESQSFPRLCLGKQNSLFPSGIWSLLSPETGAWEFHDKRCRSQYLSQTRLQNGLSSSEDFSQRNEGPDQGEQPQSCQRPKCRLMIKENLFAIVIEESNFKSTILWKNERNFIIILPQKAVLLA